MHLTDGVANALIGTNADGVSDDLGDALEGNTISGNGTYGVYMTGASTVASEAKSLRSANSSLCLGKRSSCTKTGSASLCWVTLSLTLAYESLRWVDTFQANFGTPSVPYGGCQHERQWLQNESSPGCV
ncbi:hypothetical protein [Bremerella cremea]|uniref:hypothetical protein n=1 Tax=Bremerella cremea TaxID=1031537 RepID=UPI0011C0439D|nr:hypothetical protein [Bremerella cremea]